MFLSYECISYFGYDEKTKQHSYRCKIIDSDFETEGSARARGLVLAVGAVVAQEYGKRNLNVAPNLVRAFQYISKQYSHISINASIEYYRKYNPEFHKYEKDIKKYLLLL